MEKIGILHPGEMGVSVAVSARNGGNQVVWAAEGRSEKTKARANQYGLENVGSIEELCQRCEIIISVCPPHAAEEVALAVVTSGFKGLFVDVNAIAPQKALQIGKKLEEAGGAFVDGGIIGGPAWGPGTVLYLAGTQTGRIVNCFSAGPLQTKVLGSEIGKASALKMCYAAYSKGTTALLAAILATAGQLNVRSALEAQWDADEPGFSEKVRQRTRRVTAKAWRFAGEMDEIAATFHAAGLPGGFYGAAADVYRRMEAFKDAPEMPELDVVLNRLLGK